MRTLALDPVTRDLAVTAGRVQTVEGVEAIRQKLQVRLGLWQGEWFADTDAGIPYLRMLGLKGVEAFAEATLRRAILTCPGVLSLDRFTMVVSAARHAVVSFRVTATTGDVIDVQDFVAGAS